MSFYGFAGPYLALIALQDSGALKFNTQIHILLIVMFYLVITDVTVYSRHSWDHAVGSVGSRKDSNTRQSITRKGFNSVKVGTVLSAQHTSLCQKVVLRRQSIVAEQHVSALGC
jgi:hypothetical protein